MIVMSKSIAFLLGAGCEGFGQLGLPSGKTFKRDTIIANRVADLIYSINEKKNPVIKNGTFLSYNSHGILAQTAIELELDTFGFSETEKAIVEKYISLELEAIAVPESEQKQIKSDFKQLYRDCFYNKIKELSIPVEDLEPWVQFLLDNACFYSFVDSLFNHLRKPDTNAKSVNRVVKMYFAAYKSILQGLIDEKEYSSIVQSARTTIEARLLLEKLVEDAQQRIANACRGDQNLYYNQIARFAQKKQQYTVRLTTTNYTRFAEILTGITGESLACVHGSLALFEDVKTKCVGKISEFDGNDFIFPFIFIQSGVKPIVNHYQIHEFEKASNMIINSDELFVLGYGINTDDEHISNLIKERIRSGKIVRYFLYGPDNTLEKQDRVKKALCCTEGIEFDDAANFEKALMAL